MNKSSLSTTLAILLIVVVIVAGWLWYSSSQKSYETVRSFEECVDKGYSVTEGPPRQCRTDDGQEFTEALNETNVEDETPSTTYTSGKGVALKIDTPLRDSAVQSPLEITGMAPGSWSFEATFPVKLLDSDRNVVAETFATMQGDWMTEEDVAFTSTVEFKAPESQTGYLVLERSNASGLAENEDSIEIPIRFAQAD